MLNDQANQDWLLTHRAAKPSSAHIYVSHLFSGIRAGSVSVPSLVWRLREN